jgi:hypothetical protein
LAGCGLRLHWLAVIVAATARDVKTLAPLVARYADRIAAIAALRHQWTAHDARGICEAYRDLGKME